MTKALKVTGIILGILLFLSIVAMIFLMTFVSPNRFKPLITEQVKKYSGRELIMDGDLSWQMFPFLGVKAGHLALYNPPEFKQKIFAEIDSAMISVRLMPLLRARIQSGGITLKGLKLYLIKNADGKTNWQDFSKASADVDSTPSPSNYSNTRRAALGLVISAIDISNATISWVNEQTKQTMDVEKFELHAKNINLTTPFPFETFFKFVNSNPALSGKVSLTSKISLSLEKQIFTLNDLDFSAKINKDTKNFDIGIKGSASADLAEGKIQLDNFTGHLANLNVDGKLNMTDVTSKPHMTGHLQLQRFDVKEWLKEIGQDISTLKNVRDLSGDVDFTADTTLQSVDMKGTFKLDELQTTKVRMSNINVQTQLQKGILTLVPLSASFYQGSLDGQAKIDLNNAIPQISLQTKLINVQIEPLLADLEHMEKLKISGLGNVDLKITTAGTVSDDFIKNLNGIAQLNFNNGILHGIDMSYYIDSAIALASKQTVTRTNTEQTPFGKLTASANIQKGVITNKDLIFNSSRFDTKGEGTINLVSQQINYQLNTTIKKDDPSRQNNLSNLYGYDIPVTIMGNLKDPTIRLNMDGLMKAIAQQQLQKAKMQVQEKIQDKIKKQLPDDIKNKIPENAGKLLNNLLGQ